MLLWIQIKIFHPVHQVGVSVLQHEEHNMKNTHFLTYEHIYNHNKICDNRSGHFGNITAWKHKYKLDHFLPKGRTWDQNSATDIQKHLSVSCTAQSARGIKKCFFILQNYPLLLTDLCYFKIGDSVDNVWTAGHTLQVKFALVYGRTEFPAVVSVDSQVCVHIWLVGERALDPCGTDDRV